MNQSLDQRVTRRPFFFAGGVAGAVFLLTLLILPFAGRPWPVMPAFMPMYGATVFMVEGLTAYFLAIQYQATAEPFFGALAGAYGFVMVMVVVQILTFPDVFTPTGLLGAGPQSAIWLWVFWHAGFPTFVLLALLTRSATAARWLGRRLGHAGLWLMIAGPVTACVLCACALALHGGLLPPLIVNNSYATLRHSLAARMILVMLLLALTACYRITRLRDLLSLWVGVTLFVSFADSVIVLTAAARYSLGWYTARTLSVMSSSVVLCVLIFELSKLYRDLVKANASLAERAMRDGLTGAYNRHYFDEHFAREFQRAARERQKLSLLLLDVDHFKRYNDGNGHPAGDQCLIAIVAAANQVLRRTADFLARYGGEEFAVVLPGSDADGARARAEILREAAAGTRLLHADGTAVTVSIGIATFSPLAEIYGAEELLRRADAALYAAKHGGRNQVLLFEPEAAPVAA